MQRHLLTLAALLTLTAPIVMGANFSDDYEDDALASPPDDDWYAFNQGAAGSYAVIAQPIGLGSGNKSYFQSGASTDSEHEFDFIPEIDVCNGGFLQFAWRFGGDPTGAEVFRVGLSGTTNEDQGAYVQFQSNGLVAAFSSSTGGDTGATIAAATVDTWYNVTINPDCALGRSTVFVEGVGVVTADASGTFVDLLDIRVLNPSSVDSGAISQYIDNVQLVNVIFPDITTADATVAVTSLTGFQIDETGGTLIARTDGGDFVRTYNGITLVNSGSFETNCNRADGVMAEKEFVAFFDCDAGGSNDPNFLRVRGPDLGAADIDCGSDCEFEVDMDLRQEGICDAGFASRTTMLSLGEIAYARIDWEREVTGVFSINNPHAVAWAFSTSAGRIGAAQYTAHDLDCDSKLEQSASFSPGVTPDQICSWIVDNAQKIGAVSSSTTTQLFTWTPRNRPHPGNEEITDLSGDLTGPQTYPGLAGGSAIGCGEGKFIVALGAGATDLYTYSTTTNDEIWSIDANPGVGGIATRGAAMSGDGKWVTWVAGGVISVAHALNGTVVAEIVAPAGTFKQLALNQDGSHLWYVTTDSISRFGIFPYTTGTAGCVGCETPPGLIIGGDEEPGDGLFGNSPAQVGASLGVGAFGGGLFLAVLSIGLFAFALFTESGGSKIFAYIGAVVGFIAAWAFGFIPTAVVFGIIVIAALIWYVMSKGPAEAG